MKRTTPRGAAGLMVAWMVIVTEPPAGREPFQRIVPLTGLSWYVPEVTLTETAVRSAPRMS